MQEHIHGAERLKSYVIPADPSVPRVNVNINGKDYLIPETYSVLEACRSNGIFIPTICHHPRLKPLGRCQMCVVENANTGDMIISCSTKVSDGMRINTDTPSVRTKQASVVEKFNNLKNKQDYRIKPDFGMSEFDSITQWVSRATSQSNGAIKIDPSKCVECGRCVSACSQMQDMHILDIPPGEKITSAGSIKLQVLPCIGCGQCASFCPTGAISQCDAIEKVKTNLASHKKIKIVQTAPSVRVAIAEEFGLSPGQVSTGKMVAALRALGFDYVFDTNFGADLTIMEEATEFFQRLKLYIGGDKSAHFPMFTSCCPAWINFVEQEAPDFIDNLSSCKSPMSMLSSVIRTYFAKKHDISPEKLYSVAVMPCIAKKQEAARAQLSVVKGYQDTEDILTTHELGCMIRDAKIDWDKLDEKEDFDHPLGEASGAGAIFGVTGGVMEAALRSAYEFASGQKMDKLIYNKLPIHGFDGIKEAFVDIPLPSGPFKVRVAVCSGIKYARKLVESIRAGTAPEYHFIEVMACPNGCICGGGQPKSLDPMIGNKRAKAIYSIDEKSKVRLSHENEEIKQLYHDFLGSPGSNHAHHLLHTHFNDRSGLVSRPKTEEEEEGGSSGSGSGEPFTIIYATQTGNSKIYANRLAADAKGKDVEFNVEIRPANKASLAWLSTQKRIIYITSTFGMGEQPDMGAPFYQQLLDAPDGSLSGVEYAVFGLGSKVYPMFCRAAIEVDEQLAKLGAKRFVPTGYGDESCGEKHEAAYGPWSEKLFEALGASDSCSSGVPLPKYTVSVGTGMVWPPPAPAGYELVELVSKKRIVPDGAPREALLLEFDISKTNLKYETGWHAGILPRNDPKVVSNLCRRLGLNPDMAVNCSPREGASPIPGVTDNTLTIREILEQYLAVTSRATKPFLKRLIPFAKSAADRVKLQHYVSKEGADDFVSDIVNECVTFAEVFDMFPSAHPTFEYLLEMIPQQQPRLYSIASSNLLKPNIIDLVVMVVEWDTPKKNHRIGICTDMFHRFPNTKDIQDDSRPLVAFYTKSSPLQPPLDPLVPITCIAMGSGIAPFRSFCQHREALLNAGEKLGEFTLYFGCRRRDEDCLCADELQKWEEMGVVHTIYAFSREQGEKVYFFHRMAQHPDQIRKCFVENDGFLGFCGAAGAAPKSLIDEVKRQFKEAGLDPDKRWAELEEMQRIVIEAY